MKILFVSNNFLNFGGMQQHVRDFLREAEPITRMRVAMMRGNMPLEKVFFSIKVFYEIISFRPDFIIYNHINFSPIAFAARILTGIPYGLMVYGIESWGVRNAFKRLVMRRARIIISASHFTAKRINQEMDIPLKTISVLYPTIDTNVFYPSSGRESLRSKHKLSGKKMVLFVGRLSAKDSYKGYDWVVRAMPLVLRTVPEALYVIFGGGDDEPRVKQLVAELGLEDNVRFVGAASDSDKVDYCRAADVFVMPSTGEGFGIVYLEALACGTPAIAGNQDASSEPLLGGKIGVLINPRDPNAIAGAITSVLRGQIPRELTDRNYLHTEVVNNFGHRAFGRRVKEIIDHINHGL